MTGFLAAGHAAAHSSGLLSGTTWFFIIIAGVAVARFKVVGLVVIGLLYLVFHAGGHPLVHGSEVPWFLGIAAGVFIGFQVGGRAMIRDAAEKGARGQISGARSVNGFWRSWFSDPT